MKKIKYLQSDEIKYIGRDKKMDSIGIPINPDYKKKKSRWTSFWETIVAIMIN